MSLEKIKLLVLDVDGVLTNGDLLYSQSGEHGKTFYVQDGLGMKLIMQHGIDVAIITGKQSDIVTHRMQALGIKHVFQNKTHKLPVYEELLNTLNLDDSQVAYMGDDLPDLALICRAGVGIAVPNACDIVKQHADMITKNPGGHGAVREVCDALLQAQGHFENLCEDYRKHGRSQGAPT